MTDTCIVRHKTFDEFCMDLLRATDRCIPLRNQQYYTGVSVLAFHWENEDAGIRAQERELLEVFQSEYGFYGESISIPTTAQAQLTLAWGLAAFTLKHGGTARLIIFVYSGFAEWVNGGLVLSSSGRANAGAGKVEGSTINWPLIQSLCEASSGHVLYLMNTVFPPPPINVSGVRSVGRHRESWRCYQPSSLLISETDHRRIKGAARRLFSFSCTALCSSPSKSTSQSDPAACTGPYSQTRETKYSDKQTGFPYTAEFRALHSPEWAGVDASGSPSFSQPEPRNRGASAGVLETVAGISHHHADAFLTDLDGGGVWRGIVGDPCSSTSGGVDGAGVGGLRISLCVFGSIP